MRDYEGYFDNIGITDREEKKIVLDYVSTLFNIAIEHTNKQINIEQDDKL